MTKQTVDELLERIEQLEEEQAELRAQYQQTKSQYEQVTGLFEQFKQGRISRRAFLGSVTALAGVGFAAGNASAAPDWNNTSGYAGTEAQPLIGVNASSGTFESVSADLLNTSCHFAADDGELDTVLNNVSSGDTIILQDGEFSASRDLSTRGLVIIGSGWANRGTIVTGQWTLNNHIIVRQLTARDTITVNFPRCQLENLWGTDPSAVVVKSDGALLKALNGYSVTFEAGTSGGIIDTSVQCSVTDNGTNTVGDVS